MIHSINFILYWPLIPLKEKWTFFQVNPREHNSLWVALDFILINLSQRNCRRQFQMLQFFAVKTEFGISGWGQYE